MKDSVGVKTIEERDRQFLVEKIIHSIEFNNPYENSIKKPQKLLLLLKIIIKYQGVCTSLSLLIFQIVLLNTFIRNLMMNKIGNKYLLEVGNAYELLTVFQMFYYLNERFPLTNI